MFEEEVRGSIVGQITYPYEFWTEDDPPDLIHHGHLLFENDAQAAKWFKEHYPAQFRAGAEMRTFDQ